MDVGAATGRKQMIDMGLEKWIQRKVCDGMWVLLTHIDKDVIEEFADNMAKKAEAEIHKCTCQEDHGTDGMYHDTEQDHECTCMSIRKLKEVEKEWMERGIIY